MWHALKRPQTRQQSQQLQQSAANDAKKLVLKLVHHLTKHVRVTIYEKIEEQPGGAFQLMAPDANVGIRWNQEVNASQVHARIIIGGGGYLYPGNQDNVRLIQQHSLAGTNMTTNSVQVLTRFIRDRFHPIGWTAVHPNPLDGANVLSFALNGEPTTMLDPQARIAAMRALNQSWVDFVRTWGTCVLRDAPQGFRASNGCELYTFYEVRPQPPS